MNHFIKLDDLDMRLDPKLASPYLDNFLSADRAEQRFTLIERQLGLTAIRRMGAIERYPKDQIYLDMVPIFTSAICRVFKAMKAADVAFKGYDARTYEKLFTSEIVVDLSSPTFTSSRIGG